MFAEMVQECARVNDQYQKLAVQLARPGVASDLRAAHERLRGLVSNISRRVISDPALIDIVSQTSIMGLVERRIDELDLTKPKPVPSGT
jgi:hypothetical protein